jgi:hypothetical protein
LFTIITKMSSRTSNKQRGGSSSAAPGPPQTQDQEDDRDNSVPFLAGDYIDEKPGFLYGNGPHGQGYYRFPAEIPPTTVRATKRALSPDDSVSDHGSQDEQPAFIGPQTPMTGNGGFTQDASAPASATTFHHPPQAPQTQFEAVPSISEQVSTFVALSQRAEEVRRRNYEATSLRPNFEVQRFHQAVVACLKRGLLASEQKTEKFRQEKKRMKKQIEEGSIQNFSLSSLREAPVEAQLSRLAFEELQTSNTEADYLDFDFIEMMESRRILEFASVPFDERKISTTCLKLLRRKLFVELITWWHTVLLS